MKRCFNMAAAITGLAVLSVPALATAFLMAAQTKSSPLFTQARVGQNGRLFTLYKIKTMKDPVSDTGPENDHSTRTTRLSRFIRRTRLDETPNLFNVLRGDMNIVGPRPLPPSSPHAFNSERIKVKPGLTGLSQVKGLNRMTTRERLSRDIEYVRHNNFQGDLMLIMQTPLSLIRNFSAPHSRHEDCLHQEDQQEQGTAIKKGRPEGRPQGKVPNLFQ